MGFQAKDYRGCNGPVCPEWDWGEQKERKKGIEEEKRRD